MNALTIAREMLEADSVAVLEQLLLKGTHALSCATFSGFVAVDGPPGSYSTQLASFEHIPAGFALAHANADTAMRDPVMQGMRKRSTPIIWTQDTYVDARCPDIWEAMAPWGLRNGMAMAIHLPDRRHFTLGVETPDLWHADDPQLVRLVADFTLLTVHACEAYKALLPVAAPKRLACPLTAREREVLAWSAEGKTAWAIGRILAISENTAAKHMKSAIQKLGCTSGTQAVARAIREGWIGG